MKTSNKKAPVKTRLASALAINTEYHSIVKDTECSLESLATAAKATLGKDAHLFFIAPRKGGVLTADDYDVLVADTAHQMAISQPALYGDFAQYVSKDCKSIPAIDSTAEKKAVVQFKGKQVERSVARSKVRSTAQSRLSKISDWINPEQTGTVGSSKSDPAPQSPKSGFDKIMVALNTIEKIATADLEPSYSPDAVIALVEQMKEEIMPI